MLLKKNEETTIDLARSGRVERGAGELRKIAQKDAPALADTPEVYQSKEESRSMRKSFIACSR
jgi:hypothetical protein